MSDLEQKAIERIKTASEMSLMLYKKPIVFTDSGGKDSAVICKLAENAGVPFEIIHSHTTADAPPTVYHIRKRAKMYEDKGIKYTILYPEYKGEPTSMWKLIPQKQIPPTRVARYCCKVFKEQGGKDSFIVTGVRWEESNSRKNNRGVLEILGNRKPESLILTNDNDEDRRLFETCLLKGKRVCNPIIDWKFRDVWDYLHEQKVECNPLYCVGWNRVGCVGCPMAGKSRYFEFSRFPKFKQMYINAFDKMLQERKLRGKESQWQNGNDVFHWWMEDGFIPNQLGFEDLEEEDLVENE